MSQNICEFTSSATSNCLVCTGQPAVEGVPAHTTPVGTLGWTGAQSVKRLSADLHFTFSVNANIAGAVAGLAAYPRSRVANAANITHGWSVIQVNGAIFAQVIEHGVLQGEPRAVTASTALRTQRIGGHVSYFIDGAFVAASDSSSYAALVAGGTLYATGDTLHTVSFEPLINGTTAYDSEASAELGLSVFGGDFEGGWHGIGFGVRAEEGQGGRTTLGLAVSAREGDGGSADIGFAVSGSTADIIPMVGVGSGTVGLSVQAVGFSVDMDCELAANLGVFSARAGDFDGGFASFGLRATGADTALSFDNSIVLYQSPGQIYGTFGWQRAAISDGIHASAFALGQPTFVLASAAGYRGEPGSLLQGLSTLRESAEITDTIGVLWKVLLEAGIDVAATAHGSALLSAQLVDALALVAGAGSSLEARNVVASTLAMNDALAVLAREQLTDQAAFNAAYGTALLARTALLDSVVMEATANSTATMTAIIADGLDIDDRPSSVLEAMNTLHDGVACTMTLRIGDCVYVAWVCNATTKAFARYENYPFNSYFEMGGRYYGVAPDGLYELTGDDDDGEPIAARVRTGLWNLGTGKMKRIPSLYLGYEASGNMVLKVVTTSPGGEKEENWYALRPTRADVTREGRIKIGRGLKSVYWGFELANIDGADFALDALELFPMILDRRIDGGSNG